MRNKRLIKRRNDITQGWQFCSPIALEKEGEKEKKTVLQHAVFVLGHPSKYYSRSTGLNLVERTKHVAVLVVE